MSLDHEFEALGAQADMAARRSAIERLRTLLKLRTIRAYRRLFLDDAGNLTAEAIDVIADFSRVAGLGVADLPAAGDGELRERAGRRSLALHILGRLDLDGSRLRDLARKTREQNS